MYAFYLAKSITCKTHEAILKQFASLVKSNSYPACISFFADGEMKNFDYTHLKLASGEKIQHFDQYQSGFHTDNQIALFLKTTREKKAILLKEERQSHNKTAILNPAGKVLSKFKPEHWKQITDKMGVTTLFDMLYRQRIKANYQDIENLMYARQDAVEFHSVISEILYYLNFVHEAYLCKIVGLKDIENMTKDFSDNFEGNYFVAERFAAHIKPLF
jgi:hypothetical protein